MRQTTIKVLLVSVLLGFFMSLNLTAQTQTTDKPAKEVKQAYCQAKTAKGERCKRTVKGGDKFCWQHKIIGSAKENKKSPLVQCSGKTKAGNRCRNVTRDSSGKCHVHRDKKVKTESKKDS